jgi:hypothetical protein
MPRPNPAATAPPAPLLAFADYDDVAAALGAMRYARSRRATLREQGNFDEHAEPEVRTVSRAAEVVDAHDQAGHVMRDSMRGSLINDYRAVISLREEIGRLGKQEDDAHQVLHAAALAYKVRLGRHAAASSPAGAFVLVGMRPGKDPEEPELPEFFTAAVAHGGALHPALLELAEHDREDGWQEGLAMGRLVRYFGQPGMRVTPGGAGRAEAVEAEADALVARQGQGILFFAGTAAPGVEARPEPPPQRRHKRPADPTAPSYEPAVYPDGGDQDTPA